MSIPIRGATLPATPELLRDNIEAGLRALDLTPRAVSVSAPAWPAVAAQAKKHGLDVTETRLTFTQRGPRALSFQGDVTAKVMIMKAHLTVTGDLDLDDALQLRISNLKLTGGGMAATLARGFLQPQ